MQRNLLILAALLVGLGTNARADSILDGDSVSLTWDAFTTTNIYQSYTNEIVGAGVEFQAGAVGTGAGGSETGACDDPPFCYDTAMSVDLSDTVNTISFTGQNNGANGNYGAGTFNGFDIKILSPFNGFASVTIDTNDPVWSGLLASDVTHTSTDIYVNLEGLVSGAGNQLTLDYTELASTTPEPSSLLLIGSGMAALAFRLRRRQN